jgi:hypothetical protein
MAALSGFTSTTSRAQSRFYEGSPEPKRIGNHYTMTASLKETQEDMSQLSTATNAALQSANFRKDESHSERLHDRVV